MYAYEIRRILAEPNGAAACGSILSDVAFRRASLKGWAGKCGARWDLTPIGPTPGPPPPCGIQNLERLVQIHMRELRFVKIEMTYISSKIAGITKSNLRIHVRSIHIHLPPILMNNITHPPNSLLKDAKSTRIRGHNSRQFILILHCFLFQIFHVQVTLTVAFNRNDFHACHCCRCGVGAVGGDRDETHVTVGLALRGVVRANASKTS